MANSAVDIVLYNMKQHLELGISFTFAEKEEIESLCKELEFLSDFVKDSEDNHQNELAEVKHLKNKIIDAALEAEYIMDSLMLNKVQEREAEYIMDSLMREVKSRERGAIEGISHASYLNSPGFRHFRDRINFITKKARNLFSSRERGAIEGISHAFYLNSPRFRRVRDRIWFYAINARNIYDSKPRGSGVPRIGGLSRASVPVAEEEIVVGLDHEFETIKEQLTGVSKHLRIISIVGMAGLGKTTLARKLYSDPFIMYHFYVRGWTYVSQAHKKKDMLIQILSSIVGHSNEIAAISDEKLGQELFRRLKGQKYMVVVDDIWSLEAWDELKGYFPNDCNGSRILFTTRLNKVASRAKPNGCQYLLRFLTVDESWDLLKQMVFHKETCPSELNEIGMEIAGKCQGLPLSIVVIAGLLRKTELSLDWWRKVSESINSHVGGDTKNCRETLELSYSHLPHHLKPCFIYLGTFPEDYEIPVVKLIRLWIAEGFIQQVEEKSLEHIAEEYLMDLIDRSLILASKRKCTGGVRTCRLHDVLLDFCISKAKEENFLEHLHKDVVVNAGYSFIENCLSPINGYKQYRLCFHLSPSFSSSSSISPRPSPFSSMIPPLSIRSNAFAGTSSEPSESYIHSILCFVSWGYPLPSGNISFDYRVFQGLRVLDLSTIPMVDFRDEIFNMIFLRYLALQGKGLDFPASISRLTNLETLIMRETTRMWIPNSIFMMKKLRHLSIAGENAICGPNFGHLYELQTISRIWPSVDAEHLLSMTPNLRKLGFCGNFIQDGEFWCPNLSSLAHLESLNLLSRNYSSLPPFDSGYKLEKVHFPPNLKRLTLSSTYLDWREMSVLGMLHNLEALKLEYQAFVGPRWEIHDGGFTQLKYLRLYYINIEEWSVLCTDPFPRLQFLVLLKCEKLKEIPSELGYIPTLQTIDVSWCSPSAVISARQIQEEQDSNGNDFLQISINPPDWDDLKSNS